MLPHIVEVFPHNHIRGAQIARCNGCNARQVFPPGTPDTEIARWRSGHHTAGALPERKHFIVTYYDQRGGVTNVEEVDSAETALREIDRRLDPTNPHNKGESYAYLSGMQTPYILLASAGVKRDELPDKAKRLLDPSPRRELPAVPHEPDSE